MANTETKTVGLGLPPGVLAGLVHLRGFARAARERSESVEAACSWIDVIEGGVVSVKCSRCGGSGAKPTAAVRPWREAPPKKPCDHSMQSMYFDKKNKRWGCDDCDDVEAACSWIDAIEGGVEAPLPEPIEVSGDAANYIRELQDRNARLKRRIVDLQELVQELETNE